MCSTRRRRRITHLFVDGNHILSVLGSVEQDADFNPLLLRWCAQDNYRDWITTTENIAGEMTLGKGSYAVAGRAVGERNLIVTDDGAYITQFTSQGYAIGLIGQGCGCIGPQAIAVHNNRAFWAGNKGFHVFDGAQVLPIECPVKDRFVGKIKQYQENKTFGWTNVEYGECWFHFAHTDDGNEISRYVLYNFQEQGTPWSFGSIVRTCCTRASVYPSAIAIDGDGILWFHDVGEDMPGDIVLPFLETGYITAEAGDQVAGMPPLLSRYRGADRQHRVYPDGQACPAGATEHPDHRAVHHGARRPDGRFPAIGPAIQVQMALGSYPDTLAVGHRGARGDIGART